MADTVALRRTTVSIGRYLPGIALLVGVGLTARLIEQALLAVAHAGWVEAIISNVIIAIVLGLIINNVVRLPRIFDPGLALYEFFLKVGVVFMGARVLLGDLLALGAVGLSMVLIEIAFSIGFVLVFARLFRLPEKMGSLISIGVGICGVSAIIAATPAINAKKEEASYAIAIILIFGAGALVVYPLIGHLFGMPDYLFGVWAGLAVDNTAEAVATGAIYSDQAGQYATFAKMCRNALMAFVILGFAVYYARRGSAEEIEHKGHFLWRKFPKFVIGFIAMSLLFSVLFAVVREPEAVASLEGSKASMKNLYKWAFLFTFAGVGLRTSFRDMAGAGFKPFIVGFSTEAAVAAFTLAMVLLAGHLVPQVL